MQPSSENDTMADSGASHSGARSICREIPDFCDKIAGADFAGKNLSQKSGAKVKLVRLTFATRRGPDSAPLRTWCRFQDLRDIRGAKEFNSGSPDQKTLAGRRARNSSFQHRPKQRATRLKSPPRPVRAQQSVHAALWSASQSTASVLLVTMLYFVMPNFVLGRLPCCVTSLLLHNIKHRPTA